MQLEEGNGISEEGRSMIKGMSVVKYVVIFLGSGGPKPTLLGYGLAVPFSKNDISFLLHVSECYAPLKVQFKSHLFNLSSMNNFFSELFQH